MRFKAKQVLNGTNKGKWAVFTGTKYFTRTVTEDKQAAEIEALKETGRWHQAQIDKVDIALRKLGALDERDPHGYMC